MSQTTAKITVEGELLGENAIPAGAVVRIDPDLHNAANALVSPDAVSAFGPFAVFLNDDPLVPATYGTFDIQNLSTEPQECLWCAEYLFSAQYGHVPRQVDLGPRGVPVSPRPPVPLDGSGAIVVDHCRHDTGVTITIPPVPAYLVPAFDVNDQTQDSLVPYVSWNGPFTQFTLRDGIYRIRVSLLSLLSEEALTPDSVLMGLIRNPGDDDELMLPGYSSNQLVPGQNSTDEFSLIVAIDGSQLAAERTFEVRAWTAPGPVTFPVTGNGIIPDFAAGIEIIRLGERTT